MNYSDIPKPTARELRILSILIVLALAFASLSGCGLLPEATDGGLFDVQEPDCSITVVDVMAKAGILATGSLDATGKLLVRRGKCTAQDIEIYKKAARL